jgi:extracellular elastinolytic metalloproteinase
VSSDGGVAGANSGPASPVTVTGLTTGKTYTCRVSATNSRGVSVVSVASAPVVA